MKPLVSIILPTYNGAKYIANAISSVLNQTYKEWELIIISDGSIDNTSEIVKSFSDKDKRVILNDNKKNFGIQKTLNKGIAIATGKYIARLDDDDVWIDYSKLESQVTFLETNNDFVLIGTDALVVDQDGITLSKNIMPKTDWQIRKKILSKNCFLHSTIMARKDVIVDAGGYSEDISTLHAEDYDLWLRIGLKGKIANLNILSTNLLNHSESLTSKNRISQARHIIGIIVKYSKNYPNFKRSYCVAFLRMWFFKIIKIIPVPQKFILWAQRIYRNR